MDPISVCLFNPKGGVGRSTLALNLAGSFAHHFPQARVLVADCDEQRSGIAWAHGLGTTPFTVGAGRSRGFDIELVDTSPRWAPGRQLPQADLYLVPVGLDGCSWTVSLNTLDSLDEKGARYLVVVNRMKAWRAEHRRRLDEERRLAGAPQVRDWAALEASYESGQTVYALRGAHVDKARREIDALAEAVLVHGRGRVAQ